MFKFREIQLIFKIVCGRYFSFKIPGIFRNLREGSYLLVFKFSEMKNDLVLLRTKVLAFHEFSGSILYTEILNINGNEMKMEIHWAVSVTPLLSFRYVFHLINDADWGRNRFHLMQSQAAGEVVLAEALVHFSLTMRSTLEHN